MSDTEHTDLCDTEVVNALLRGEAAAVETYTRALGQFDDPEVICDLQRIRDEHRRAVRELRDYVVRHGGEPADRPGTWGEAAPAAIGAKSVGPAAVLAALRQGEEATAAEYEAVLGGDGIPADCQRVIRTDLMAACRRHAGELDRLLGGLNH